MVKDSSRIVRPCDAEQLVNGDLELRDVDVLDQSITILKSSCVSIGIWPGDAET
jgi:hypothetical protein